MPMKILIVDDHALIREGVAAMILSLRPDAQVLQAESCAQGLQVASSHALDLVFMDLQLPDQPGFVALERCRELYPTMPVVVLSGQEDRNTVLRSLDLGAKAFVPKSADAAKIRGAIEVLLDGRIFLPESVMGAPAGARPDDTDPWGLTERQRGVLALVIAGLSNKLIARKLDIAESTVKIHVSAILRQLKVTSRTQALIVVARSGVRLQMAQ